MDIAHPTEVSWDYAFENNIPFFLSFLLSDVEQHTSKSSYFKKNELLEFPVAYIEAMIGMYRFLFIKNDAYIENEHVMAGCCIVLALHNVYEKELNKPQRNCFIRRDCVWVCLMALLTMFKESVKKGEIKSPLKYSQMKEVIDGLNLGLPIEWVTGIQDLNLKKEKIASITVKTGSSLENKHVLH